MRILIAFCSFAPYRNAARFRNIQRAWLMIVALGGGDTSMDRTSSFPKQDFEGMVLEIWSGLDICLYHAAYVKTYADSAAMRLAGSRRRETTLQQMSQAERDLLQEDVLVFRAHFAGVLWQLHHVADELIRLAYRR